MFGEKLGKIGKMSKNRKKLGRKLINIGTVVEKLVKVDADFTKKNKNNKSALDYAKSYNDEKLNKLLNLQKI